ncbi:MAG: electron transfer flavoprotein subunit alpha/FixB family protein, partial [Saprospiraceae bacterium]
AKGILALMPNGYGLHEQKGSDTKILNLDINIPDSKIVLKDQVLIKGKTPLSEADIVVSAGRGMKDPSNWNLIEELADLVNATTACSRPVADSGWRPHHEHVGQTGIAIRPNVYIAIGISGAIQHLAGVNNSKKIFVINKDPEAPFFKAADYGVCGDLFEILPKLNEALRKAK